MTRADIDRWTTRLLPVLVGTAGAAAFLPALGNGWVGWDDDFHFLTNPHYRGLGPEQLRWMFEGPHIGQYFPVTWLTLGLDYRVWGMEAGGYHLTSVLIHAAAAVLLYFVMRRLFALGAPRATGERAALAAAFTALAYAVHPLRVESVAWASERRDVLSLFFYLAAVLCYLRACAARAADAWRWRAAALAAYSASLLSKAIGVTLPAALLILDIYPLGRLHADPRRWTARDRSVLVEKAPFALLSAAGLLAGWAGLRGFGALTGLGDYGVQPRLAQASHSVLFYLAKTVWPSGLRPLYEAPRVYSLSEPRFALALAGTLALVAGLWASARRMPALAAAGAFYLITLAPVSGLVRNGLEYLAVDRYCYLASLGVAAVLGAAFLAGVRRARGAALAVAAAVLSCWGVLSWRQTGCWRDSKALWGRTLAVDPDNSVGHMNMAAALAEEGDFEGALTHAERATELRPEDPAAHDAYGVALLRLGRPAAAQAAFAEAVVLRPDDERAYGHLGRALADQGRHEQAVLRERQALLLDDSDAPVRFALGNSLAALGRRDAAEAEYERALRDDPSLAAAHLNLGLLRAASGRPGDAIAEYRLALRSRDQAAAAQFAWGNLLSDRGDLAAASRRYREAARLDPSLLAARFNLGNVLAAMGHYGDAAAEYRAVLARDPGNSGARANLDDVLRRTR